MSTEIGRHKLEPRLLQAIERIKVTALDEPLPVIISCVGDITVPKGKSRSQAMQYIQKEAEALQQPVVTKLEHLGIAPSEINQTALSNSISISLTLNHLVEIIKLDQVKFVRLSAIDQVRDSHAT